VREKMPGLIPEISENRIWDSIESHRGKKKGRRSLTFAGVTPRHARRRIEKRKFSTGRSSAHDLLPLFTGKNGRGAAIKGGGRGGTPFSHTKNNNRKKRDASIHPLQKQKVAYERSSEKIVKDRAKLRVGLGLSTRKGGGSGGF